MQALMILYKSALEIERVKELFRARTGKYRAVKGLLQKLYVHDPSTDHVGGIYVFDTKEDLDAFRGSDLEKSIEKTYQFTERPTIRAFDVVHALHDEAKQPDDENIAVFRRVIDRGFNEGNLKAVEQLLAPDYRDHQDGISPPTIEGMRSFIKAARTAFPDLELTIEEIVASGDKTWARTTARGTHRGPFMGLPPTGKRFVITRFDLCRFQDRKIVEHWAVIDRFALLQQLGGRIAPAQPRP